MNSVANYNMSGCSHCICRECADTMANDEKHNYAPFGEFVGLSITLLQCPFCRAWERMCSTYRSCLNKTFPQAYRIWFETELFRDEDGTMFYTSRRKNNMRLFPETEDDIYSLMERVHYTSRTTGCYVDDDNIYVNPEYFFVWSPAQHRYAQPYISPPKLLV